MILTSFKAIHTVRGGNGIGSFSSRSSCCGLGLDCDVIGFIDYRAVLRIIISLSCNLCVCVYFRFLPLGSAWTSDDSIPCNLCVPCGLFTSGSSSGRVMSKSRATYINCEMNRVMVLPPIQLGSCCQGGGCRKPRHFY